ncbi:hypothetical protein GCM10009541_57620 [Micromonospora gifhornensis]|uniref:Uncharacterized protein n=1 Tax=Micromonospora gifhornensis TaxID=84594 RepID=A0ABQ4IJ93_9ACTN|nr:hypothetical protein [Micromonospora gifhornensis]GIJ17970.1 hypothetical protein Vgi01_46540 [Micromonospora gifhornensis]
MEFLLAFALTGLLATGGWIAYAGVRGWSRFRDRRHEVRLARAQAAAEIRQAELRQAELANETYQDFVRRHPQR